MWEDKLSEHQISCWRAVSAAGLQGKGSRKRQEGTGSIRFVPVPDFSNIHGLASVRVGSENNFRRFDAVRPAFFGRVVARSGSVRFVSASDSVWFQN